MRGEYITTRQCSLLCHGLCTAIVRNGAHRTAAPIDFSRVQAHTRRGGGGHCVGDEWIEHAPAASIHRSPRMHSAAAHRHVAAAVMRIV